MRGVFCVCTFATLRFSPYFCANIPHRAVPSPKATVRTSPLVLFFSTMKILITGAAGFVGCRATRFLGLSHQVIPLDSRQLDITDEQRVQTLFMDHAPKAIIHLAALADTGYCETHPDDCEAVNYDGTLNVARAAAAVGAKLIYAGSDQVYNGCTGSEARGEDALLSPGACMPASSIAQSARSKRFSPLRCAYASRGCMMCPTPRCDKTVDCCSDSWNLHNTAHLLPLRRTNAAASPMCGRWCAASKRPSGYPAAFTTLVRPTIALLTTPCSKLRVSLPLPGTSKPGHRRLFVPSNNRNVTCP